MRPLNALIGASLLIQSHNPNPEGLNMRAFVLGCIAAAVIAVGGVVVLDGVQKPATVAYQTSGVRL
jgi:hypothetical protein